MHQLELLVRLFCSCAAAGQPIPAAEPASTLLASPSEAAPESSARKDSAPDCGSLLEELIRGQGAAPEAATGAGTIPNNPALSDRFFFALGYGEYTSNTEARLDSPAGIGTNLDFEDVLGLDETAGAPQLQARWRFSDRWRVELEYFELNRTSSKQLTGDIEWNGVVYPVDTVIDAKYNTAVTRASCGYSFFKTQDKEVGVALGFHVTQFDIALKAQGGNGGGEALLAPLPVLSTYGLIALTDEWSVAMRLDAFQLVYDPYEGHIYSMGLDVMYQPWRHVALGFAWRSLDIGLSMSNNDWNGEIKTHYQGPSLYLASSF